MNQIRASPGGSSLPHVDDCNFCSKCIVDEEPSRKMTTIKDLMAELGELRKTLPPPAASPPPPQGEEKPRRTKRGRFSDLLEPLDEAAKALKPNCTECRGCNYELRDISSAEVQFQHIHFQHGSGATSNWMFFATRPGEAHRYTVKVFCIPFDKRMSFRRGAKRGSRDLLTNECSSKTASDRLELLLIQERLMDECGVHEMFPRLWVSKISAVIPGLSYHVRWYGVWMEEARGITLFALHTSKDKRLALRLQQKLNRTQVLLGAIWDLLTAQCDRHSENIFVDDEGQVQYIDNDKALGAVSKCGLDSMLIPGTRYHSVLRIGFWHQLAVYYRNLRAKEGDKLCRGMIDPRVVIDYRCSLPGGRPKLGVDYPPNMNKCLKSFSEMSVESLVDELGMSTTLPAEIVRQRSIDMLSLGFEETMDRGDPTNSFRFRMPHQPPCCNVAVINRMIMCESCWQPLLPEDFSNSTDLTLVSSLVSRNRGSELILDAELSRMQLNSRG